MGSKQQRLCRTKLDFSVVGDTGNLREKTDEKARKTQRKNKIKKTKYNGGATATGGFTIRASVIDVVGYRLYTYIRHLPVLGQKRGAF